jgi:hypothetical protein
MLFKCKTVFPDQANSRSAWHDKQASSDVSPITQKTTTKMMIKRQRKRKREREKERERERVIANRREARFARGSASGIFQNCRRPSKNIVVKMADTG